MSINNYWYALNTCMKYFFYKLCSHNFIRPFAYQFIYIAIRPLAPLPKMFTVPWGSAAPTLGKAMLKNQYKHETK
jgi:hypothetical protein